jgi:hypothetical protein
LRTTKNVGPFIREACVCKNGLKGYRIVKHTIYDKIKKWNDNLGEDNPTLHSKKMKKRLDKNKILSFYFIKKLLMKLGLNEERATKCSKASPPVTERVLKLCQLINSGIKSIMELKILEKWLCKDLKIIPTALSDRLIYKDIKLYMSRHLTATKRILK